MILSLFKVRVLGYMVPLCSEQSLGFNVEKKKTFSSRKIQGSKKTSVRMS